MDIKLRNRVAELEAALKEKDEQLKNAHARIKQLQAIVDASEGGFDDAITALSDFPAHLPDDSQGLATMSFSECMDVLQTALNKAKEALDKLPTPDASIITYFRQFEVKKGALYIAEHRKEESAAGVWSHPNDETVAIWKQLQEALTETLRMLDDASFKRAQKLGIDSVSATLSHLQRVATVADRTESTKLARTGALTARRFNRLLAALAQQLMPPRLSELCDHISTLCAQGKVWNREFARTLRLLDMHTSVVFKPAEEVATAARTIAVSAASESVTYRTPVRIATERANVTSLASLFSQ